MVIEKFCFILEKKKLNRKLKKRRIRDYFCDSSLFDILDIQYINRVEWGTKKSKLIGFFGSGR
jgi:uncharacterized protein YlaI